MKKLYIAINKELSVKFQELKSILTKVYQREIVTFQKDNLAGVSSLLLTPEDLYLAKEVSDLGYTIPIFLLVEDDNFIPNVIVYPALSGIIDISKQSTKFYANQINHNASFYEEQILPPFFKNLINYVQMGNTQFDCPGHQGGQFFKKHPAGKQFYDFFGENIFRSDLCNADVALGDLLIHEGPALQAQKYAAKVFNSDKTYFVLNGSSASNKVACTALVTPGDLVLFDRNNHKSATHGALIQNGGVPIYLETSRNPYGFIGGIKNDCYDEKSIRKQIALIDPDRAKLERPFRLAIIQLGTYDGTIANSRVIMDKIGHLCDYILFDSAWVGYEQFIPFMKDCSPLLLDLKPTDAGVIVVQSVHKQQAGLSQASYIHKKDSHIKGQKRYCNHKRFNNAFMSQASTSPFYPLFASLDINAKIHEGNLGKNLWAELIKIGIETRKELNHNCTLIKPFVPDIIDGKSWYEYDTQEIISDIKFFKFDPKSSWHKFDGYGQDQYFIDPAKLLLTTPGIKADGSYDDFGIPAVLLAQYLREHGVVPEKCDLNSILFLLTPGVDQSKLRQLIAHIARFEDLIYKDAPLEQVLPEIYKSYSDRYYKYTIRQLCQEMHDLYKNSNVKELQHNMFDKQFLPTRAMTPYNANVSYFRGKCSYTPLKEVVNKIVAEGALPYPPGVLTVIPGER
ncbi:MAG: ornithine decarboxylase, partial [Psittacicella sp.]